MTSKTNSFNDFNPNRPKQTRNDRMFPFIGTVAAAAIVVGVGVVGFEKAKSEFEHSQQHEIIETHLQDPGNPN